MTDASRLKWTPLSRAQVAQQIPIVPPRLLLKVISAYTAFGVPATVAHISVAMAMTYTATQRLCEEMKLAGYITASNQTTLITYHVSAGTS